MATYLDSFLLDKKATVLLGGQMNDYALVDMKKLEDDLLKAYKVSSGRFPSTEQVKNRERLAEFVRLTKKYIITDRVDK